MIHRNFQNIFINYHFYLCRSSSKISLRLVAFPIGSGKTFF